MSSRGQVLPLVALYATVLFGAAALAIDVGYLRYMQRIQQSATDSAAVAATSELIYASGTTVTTAAKQDAGSNGFTDDGTNVIVTVNNPPTSGAYSGNTNAVEVLIRKKDPLFFAGVFGLTSQWVQTRAVGQITNTSNSCIYALNGDITLSGGGGGGITAPSCGLITNGNLNVSGSGNVNALSVGYVGTGPSGGTYPLGQPARTVPVSDPCLTYAGCAYLSRLTTTQLRTGCMAQSPLPNPIPPGEYCQTLTISGSMTLSPGLFVLDNGISVGGNSALSGTGVTIYSLGGVTTLYGHVSVNLSAPTTGPMAGMVYYQPAGNTNGATFSGAAGSDTFSGAMYMPSASMTFNANMPSITFLVPASVTMNGGGMGAGPSSNYPGLPHAVLAE